MIHDFNIKNPDQIQKIPKLIYNYLHKDCYKYALFLNYNKSKAPPLILSSSQEESNNLF